MVIDIINKTIPEVWNVLKWLDVTAKSLKDGEYEISISKVKKSRSLSQNKLMWLWFKCISDETGTEIDDIHDYFCNKFLKRAATIRGKEVMICGTTSTLNKDDFSLFLNKIQAEASSEFGIILPLPEDLCFNDFIEEYI